ncbi:MAG: hypothetical protein ACI3X3_01875 [Acidaminococcus sp.]|jgi:hypothetical protein|uniref:hypothetical protein n=1 Tax=Acidaminococcus sp. TaxID=1872103 RepID=UPI003F17D96A|nr:hypothetical protein [Acidaminococcus sp.]
MGYKSITEIQEETKTWDFIDQLPEQVGQFTKKRVGTIDGQILTICRYEAPALRASLDITYSSETFDYILVHTMGMNSYRDIRFIYKEKDIFAQKVQNYLPRILDAMEHPTKVNLGEMVAEKGILTWDYGNNLPEKIGPFELYIKPANAIEHINGSIIMIDYSNFARKDQLIIMYNRLRDEFFGEVKINSVFHASMDFDSKNLKQLEQKLKEHLEPTLKWVDTTDHTI